VIATNTGGIGSLVADGVSGWLCEPDASPDALAERIVQTIRDPHAYRQMCLAAHAEYRKRLNWATAGAKIKLALENLLANGTRPGTDGCGAR
jgi:glycosyltransferase involved in cell wall biosynthesis